MSPTFGGCHKKAPPEDILPQTPAGMRLARGKLDHLLRGVFSVITRRGSFDSIPPAMGDIFRPSPFPLSLDWSNGDSPPAIYKSQIIVCI